MIPVRLPRLVGLAALEENIGDGDFRGESIGPNVLGALKLNHSLAVEALLSENLSESNAKIRLIERAILDHDIPSLVGTKTFLNCFGVKIGRSCPAA